jgi:hypothetical protein
VYQFGVEAIDNQFSDGCQLVRPTIYGSTRIAYVAPGTNAGPGTDPVIWDLDLNLLPQGGLTFTDPGAGAVISNHYITNAGGVSKFTPQSDTADIIRILLPAGSAQAVFKATDIAGKTQVSLSTVTGLKALFWSSDPANGGFIGVGFNETGGFAAIGQTFAGLAFVVDGATVNGSAAGIFALAAENQALGAIGTDIEVHVIPPGTSTVYKAARFYGNGDILLNATGGALATGATSGFTGLPTMAGQPTGVPTVHVGVTDIVYDTTNKTAWAYTSGLWQQINAQVVAATGPATGTTFTPNSFNRLGAGDSGNAYKLPDATKNKGALVTIKVTNPAGLYRYTLTDFAGADIDGAASYSYASFQEYTATTFESDGSNWWSVTATNPAYADDYPAQHGLTEWMGPPAAQTQTRTPTSGTVNVMRLVPKFGGLISNVSAVVLTLGSAMTAATAAAITNVVNNGGGLCRCTSVGHPFVTNDVVTDVGVVGVPGANGAFVISVIDANTFDLLGSVFSGAYVSGGTATRSANCCAVYDAAGAFLSATGDQAVAWTTTGAKTMALATAVTLNRGAVYYVVLLYNGTALAFAGGAGASAANIGLSAATLRWSSNGVGAGKLPSSIVPASNSGSVNVVSIWSALS